VRKCEELECDLADLDLSQLKAFDANIEEDVFEVLTLEGSVNARNHIGGTAPERVKQEAERILAD
jgi:argininosuccinate lyase